VSERTDILRSWRQASPSQRAGLAAVALICIGLLALTVALARRPRFAVLYARLSEEDAAKVVGRLREMKAPYRVAPGGTVEAPAERIAELRLDLAADGLPTGGQAGFELFDRTRVGISEFGERLNYQRALQGELARTIAHLAPVEHARVHVTLPRERLYAREQERATASVVLGLRGGAALTPAQVRSIVHLVSGAVEGLEPDSVTILDTEGRLLSSAEGGGLAAASTHLQLQRDYERQVEHAVQSMLDGVLGAGLSVVRASASLNFDQVERESETYEPAEAGVGVVVSRRETRESYRGRGSLRAVGVPGVSSNVGDLRPGAAGDGAADEYEHSELTEQYLVSREVQRTLRPPGQVERLSLSVFISEDADLGPVADLEGAVVAAAGLDPARGDRVVVTRLPFRPPAEEQGEVRAIAVREFYFRVARDFVAIVLAALFFSFVVRLARRPTGRAAQPAAPQPAAPSDQGPATEPSLSLNDFDPDRGAAVLRQWLAEDEEGRDEGDAQPEQALSGAH